MLGIEGRGYLLLARRSIQEVLSYLVFAFSDSSSGGSGDPANRNETILAAEALKHIYADQRDFAERLLEFLSEGSNAKGSGKRGKRKKKSRARGGSGTADNMAWQAMRLAAAAVVVPHLIFKRPRTLGLRRDTAEEMQGDAHQEDGYGPIPVEWISTLFESEEKGGRASRNFLVRCLVSQYDEKGVSRCGICTDKVGKWIREEKFLDPYVDGRMRDLIAFEGLQDFIAADEEIDDVWARALQFAANRRLRPHYNEDEARSFAGRIKSALDKSEGLDFCRLPCAMWCILLNTLDNGGILATEDYRNEKELNRFFFPGAPDGQLEMLRRIGEQSKHASSSDDKLRTINRCDGVRPDGKICGELYYIANCGMPMQEAKCATCRSKIGGANHEYAAGSNQGIACIEQNENLAVRGINDLGQIDAVQGLYPFVPGQGHTERELQPLHYRILSLLLLMPLSIFSPNKEERTNQLRDHWKVFKEVSQTSSDTDAQHLFMGILIRAAQHRQSLEGLAMSGCDFTKIESRKKTEDSFGQVLRIIFNGQGPDSIVSEVQGRLQHADR
jgi:hypothetical protein